MNKLNIASIIALITFAILSTYYVTQRFFPSVEYVGTPTQVQVDENTWVLRTVYNSRGQMLDSLKKNNTELYRQLRRDKNKIANLTAIIGELNTSIDSLNSSNTPQSIPGAVFPDTTLTFTETFGDSLFQITSNVILKDSTVSNTLQLNHLRTIRIDIATTLSDDKSVMHTYVSSSDFQSLEYRSTTSLKKDKLSWWQWGLLGLSTGVIITSVTQ